MTHTDQQQANAPATTTQPAKAPLSDEDVQRILDQVDSTPHEKRLDPKNMQELDAWCSRVARSKMYGVQSDDDAFMRITTGAELGLSAATATRLLFSFESKGVRRIGLDASLMMALCLKRRAVCEYFRFVGSDNTKATFVTKRTGDPEVALTFTIKEAESAGLTSKDVWKSWPARMLEARCKSALARLVYPDILGGLYDADELREEADAEAEIRAAAARQARPGVAGVARPKAQDAKPSPAPSQPGSEAPTDYHSAARGGRIPIAEGEDADLKDALARAEKAAKATKAPAAWTGTLDAFVQHAKRTAEAIDAELDKRTADRAAVLAAETATDGTGAAD